MSTLEAAVMTRLGWKAAGLIESAGNGLGTQQAGVDAKGDTAAAPRVEAVEPNSRKRRRRSAPSSDIRLLACDMDGTLLDSRSRMLPSTVEALKVSLPSISWHVCCGAAQPCESTFWLVVSQSLRRLLPVEGYRVTGRQRLTGACGWCWRPARPGPPRWQ